MAAKTELVDKSEVINAKDVVDVTETTLTVFTPLVIQPIEAGYLHFHNVTIPKMVCKSCGKSTAEEGTDYRPLQPRYPEGFQI